MKHHCRSFYTRTHTFFVYVCEFLSDCDNKDKILTCSKVCDMDSISKHRNDICTWQLFVSYVMPDMLIIFRWKINEFSIRSEHWTKTVFVWQQNVSLTWLKLHALIFLGYKIINHYTKFVFGILENYHILAHALEHMHIRLWYENGEIVFVRQFTNGLSESMKISQKSKNPAISQGMNDNCLKYFVMLEMKQKYQFHSDGGHPRV